jgi:hypothetical protein
MKYKITLFFTLLMANLNVFAQELNCQVTVISPSLQTSAAEKQVFEELQLSVLEFMNNTRWSNDIFGDNEKIECIIQINISEQISSEDFGGDIQISASRPVFNSSYSTSIFNFKDTDFKFKYQRGTPIRFSIDQHRTNLSSVLAFYAYMILGYDYDTFSEEGGSPYFIKAQQIVNNAQNASEPGWKASESTKNRFAIVDNALQNVFKPLRKAYFMYHRDGFDIMYEDVEKGRTAVFQALSLIEQVHKVRPGSINTQIFFTAKRQEIINLFKEGSVEEKTNVLKLLKKLDGANASKYEEINKE